ncbi:MAG: hypothetical protein E6Q56_10545 [Mycobacterium sp.]|nr:MAG: hypothetical protein E6Q56_10545 [Mycobacterium sp.]
MDTIALRALFDGALREGSTSGATAALAREPRGAALPLSAEVAVTAALRFWRVEADPESDRGEPLPASEDPALPCVAESDESAEAAPANHAAPTPNATARPPTRPMNLAAPTAILLRISGPVTWTVQ